MRRIVLWLAFLALFAPPRLGASIYSDGGNATVLGNITYTVGYYGAVSEVYNHTTGKSLTYSYDYNLNPTQRSGGSINSSFKFDYENRLLNYLNPHPQPPATPKKQFPISSARAGFPTGLLFPLRSGGEKG